MYYTDDTILYLNGEFVKASEAKIDLYSQSLHYGYSVFEGIRSYRTIDDKTKIFKAEEHYKRLKDSADAVNIPFPFKDLITVTYELLAINYLQDAYIKDWIHNTMIFLEVDDVKRYWTELQSLGLDQIYKKVKLTPIREESWGRECFMHDPSGVLWHFGEFF